MLVKKLIGKSVDFEEMFPLWDIQCIKVFYSGNIFTLINQRSISYEIFILDQTNQTYNHFHLAFDPMKEFYITYELLINDNLLIFHDSFTRIGVFNILSKSFNIIDSGIQPKQYPYQYYNTQIYEVKDGFLRVFDFSQFPKISEYIHVENIRSIKQIIQLESRWVIILQHQTCRSVSYYALPIRRLQEELYFDISTIKFMFIRASKGQLNFILAKIYLERIQFEEGVKYHYKSYNVFQEQPQLHNKIKICVRNRRHATLFQLTPKQKILRKFKQLQFQGEVSIVFSQFIIGETQFDNKGLSLQDVVTAKLTLFNSQGRQIFQGNHIVEIKKGNISVYELSAKESND